MKRPRSLRALGPGVISGAADDDPSGIVTYSIVGATSGLALLWTAALTWLLRVAVQMSCARIGMVTGGGLLASLRRRLPRPLIVVALVALLGASSINIGADLSGMADALEVLTGLDSRWLVAPLGAAIALAAVLGGARRVRPVRLAPGATSGSHARARRFHAGFRVPIALGVGLDFVGVKPFDALYWSAVLNGVLAPLFLVGVPLVATDAVLMRGQRSPRATTCAVGVTTAIMTVAAVALLVV